MSFPPPVLLQPLGQQQQDYRANPNHGSVGPLIGVLAVVAILGTVAVGIGRLCSGRGIMGRGYYDFESWFEKKCGFCIDGRLDLPPPPPQRLVEQSRHNVSVEASPAAEPASQGMGEPEETVESQNVQHV